MGLFDFIKKQIAPQKGNVAQTNSSVSKTSSKIEFDYETDNEVPSLESRLSKAYPSKHGLYPHEILMLDYAHTYKNTKNQFQNFWKWNYSVDNPQSVLDSLLQRGFIIEGNARSTLTNLKVGDLKDLLTKVGEKTTGKKEELIQRILTKYSDETLTDMFPEKYFEVTQKGIDELSQNAYVPYLHRHSYMNIWEMNYYLNYDNPSHLGYRDILWREFNKQAGEHFQNCDFGLYRNIRLNMHDFLIEESKYKTALHMLVEVASFDLSGLGNGDKPGITDRTWRELRYQSKLANLFFDDEQEAVIPPGIINYFMKLHELLGMPENEFKENIYEEFSKVKIHERVFSHDECANIVLASLGLEERKIKNSRKVVETRLKKMLSL